MEPEFYRQLHEQGIISDASFEKVKHKHQNVLFSLHWELKTILYLGVTLLSGGLGTLIYKNIDTIGHQVILALIALVSASSFFYCSKHVLPFSKDKVASPNTSFDYVLLLGAITMVSFAGYIQYQYNIFGNNYGLATLFPMLALFYIAHRFDHLGILSMAIVSLGLWMGLTVTPKKLLSYGTFNSQTIIGTYLTFGVLLLIAGFLTQRYDFKKHFKFSYHHYGVHVTYIALYAGYFYNYQKGTDLLFLAGVIALTAYLYFDSLKTLSYYFMVITVLYGYFGVCCLIVRLCMLFQSGEAFSVGILAFLLSGVGLILLLIELSKKMRGHDRF
ncbi:DUF2157 domain-containing protein [Mucilaginibacter glaciei]|uniref:DUF2157 domain-containing protein n=1 Tax=Mucilaginibacter glaciei TaxID=2772109 RepID=A0A926S0B3_9SPHI|nr:DUF2157 domain-containing protein [Mucilaginibacter glaciei]MBD1391542.1 DUF2157 domain-containing protein [Mucilaginibacter glaciei]